MLVRGINGILIILSVLVLCLTISSAVLGIKSLKKTYKKENKVQPAQSQQLKFEYEEYEYEKTAIMNLTFDLRCCLSNVELCLYPTDRAGSVLFLF